MSEGETAPAQPTRQSDLNPPYLKFPGQPGSHPIPQLKSKTRYGVMFMFYAILMLLISAIFGFFYMIYFYIYFSPYSYSDPGTWILMMLLSGISFFILIMILILFVISVIFFSIGKREFGGEHQKNVKWGTYFIITYIVVFIIQVFILPMFLIFLPWGIYLQITMSLSVFSVILDAFLLAFAILILVREVVKSREKDLLYLFASLYILFAIIDAILYAIIYTKALGYDSSGLYYVSIFLDFLRIFILLLAFLAYYRLFKSFDSRGFYTPQESSSFLPRPKPIDNWVGSFYSKPVMAFIAILITAMFIGAATAVRINIPDPFDSSGDPFSMDFDFGDQNVVGGYRDGTDMISEGESRQTDIPIEGNLQYVEVFAYWQDEPDQAPRENQPDSFTIEVSFGDHTEAHSGENPQGGEGIIQFNFYVEEADAYYTGSMDFIITLDYAGDQTNPLGIGPGFFNIEDNSNEIYWEIVYQYYE